MTRRMEMLCSELPELEKIEGRDDFLMPRNSLKELD